MSREFNGSNRDGQQMPFAAALRVAGLTIDVWKMGEAGYRPTFRFDAEDLDLYGDK